jgi:hypothetical protein
MGTMKAKCEMTLFFLFFLFPKKIDFSFLVPGYRGDDCI